MNLFAHFNRVSESGLDQLCKHEVATAWTGELMMLTATGYEVYKLISAAAVAEAVR